MPLAVGRLLPESICFVGQEGWLAGRMRPVGEQAVATKAVLFRTTDAGEHWSQVQTSTDDPFFSEVRFADRDNGWLVGRDNVYRTQDRGKNWTRVLSLPSPE
jgi:photosystem II stability/assembly factor-like uncharacterized protein